VTILLEEPDEEEGSYSLIAIGEGVILDDEVEEVSGLLLDGRVEIRAIEGRDDSREYTDEALIFFIAEDRIGLR
jgi:hypothetical protein